MVSKVDKKNLVKLAKAGDKQAEEQLLELNQLGILEEAKNPDTAEDIAIEMLAELSLSRLELIRTKAISLLLKLVPNRLEEKILDSKTSLQSKERIIHSLINSSDLNIMLLMSLYETEALPEDLKSLIVNKVADLRRNVEKNAAEVMKLQLQIDEILTQKNEKFQMISDLYAKLSSIRTEKLSNKIFHDFKLDVELSYQSLKSNMD